MAIIHEPDAIILVPVNSIHMSSLNDHVLDGTLHGSETETAKTEESTSYEILSDIAKWPEYIDHTIRLLIVQ